MPSASLFSKTASAAVIVALITTMSSVAQDIQWTTLDSDPEGLVLEIEAKWPIPLQTIVDSTAITIFDLAAARALSLGVPETSETLDLPSLEHPDVTILAAEYSDLRLPTRSDTSTWFQSVTGPIVYAEDLGMSRKRPVISVTSRLLAYDTSSGTVRRYRRLRIAVRYRGGAPKLNERVANNPHLGITESALADGAVFKIPVSAEGVYVIDRSFLSNVEGLDISPDAIDPDDIRIFGNGGRPLPARNDAPRPADLVENAVHRVGGGDGRFDEGDRILFYAKGPTGWTFNAQTDEWEHYVHPFSNVNYYFLKIESTNEPESIDESTYPNYGDAESISKATGRYVRDFDEFMWSRENPTGHTWVSQTIRTGSTRDLISALTLHGYDGSQIDVRARVAIASNPAATLLFEADGEFLAEERARGTVSPATESPAARPSTASFTYPLPAGEPLSLSMRLDPATEGAHEAAADWIRIFYPMSLTAQADMLHFTTPPGRAGRFEILLSGFTAAPYVWDVTDPTDVRDVAVRAEGSSTYKIQVEAGDPARPRELRAFVAETARPLPVDAARRIPNQNLHGTTTYPEFVIVTPDEFIGPAEELAEHRRQEGLQVLVADIREIYNEFSGGLHDVRGLRDYLKFLYDRAPSETARLRYVLLFGDGHVNYRNLGLDTQQATLQNWIPPYETEESLHPVTSYTSDDYFGLLDDNEGDWHWPGCYACRGAERVDLGIGRFPVQTVEEARAVVAKIKHYENPSTYGPWRSRYLFVADDGYNGLSGSLEGEPDLHTQNSDVVAQLVGQVQPRLNLKKIYGISYVRDFRNGWRLPGVERDVKSALNDGVLIMNYSGHGGESGLAQEEIFTRSDAEALQNIDRLPLFITATCSFGWWDLGREQSGAEVLLLNPNGGAVALMTTVRLVHTSRTITTLNVGLNRALNAALFEPDADGLPPRLGEVLRRTKNVPVGLEGNNRKFSLLGDPTLRIGLPSRHAVIEAVNESPLSARPQLRALEEITLQGAVRDRRDQVDPEFNGNLHVSVFDAQRRVQLDEDDVSAMPQNYYMVREDVIWRGTVPVRAGRFDAAFIIPKDISYSNESGRISLYAHSSTDHAAGATEDVTVGGTAENPPTETIGPEIELFLNDTTFVSGGLTAATPKLLIKLADDSGINSAGAGVGHETLLVVDHDEQNAVDVGSKFESDPASYKRGRITYSFEDYPVDLDDGPHTLSVRAWDILNNSTTESLDFFVAADDGLVLRNVFNYPNPTSGFTRFVFEHNQPPGTAADVQVRIYTLAGRPIRTIETDEAVPSGILPTGPVQIPWNGRDEDFNAPASGIYLYKLRVTVDGADGERYVSERIEKLAVIR